MTTSLLHLAAFQIGTHALGPGFRAGVWAQGCPFHCRGCIAPEWILPGGEAVQVSDLAERIAADERLEGLTLSGGEPMQQAGALAELVRQVKHNRPELNVICFTGYRYEELLSRPPNAGVAELLAQVDLLIDGPFIEAQNDDLGLRGSANQVFHYLTDRLKGQGLESSPRRVEVSLRDGQAFIIGVPPKGFRAAWEQAMLVVHKERDR